MSKISLSFLLYFSTDITYLYMYVSGNYLVLVVSDDLPYIF